MTGFDRVIYGLWAVLCCVYVVIGLAAWPHKLMRCGMTCVIMFMAVGYVHSLDMFPHGHDIAHHPNWIKQDQEIVGRVLAVVKLGAHYQKYIVALNHIGSQAVNLRICLSCYGYWPVMSIGDVWRLRARLYNPQLKEMYLSYKYWLALRHIDLLGTILHGRRYYAKHMHALHGMRFNHRISHARNMFVHGQFLNLFSGGVSLERLRQQVVIHLMRVISNPEIASFITALCVGSRVTVSPAQWHILAVTGTNHLIAVAGLHIGTLLLLSGIVLRCIKLPYRLYYYPHVAYVLSVCLLIALAYGLLSGFALPARRTLLMFACYVLATLQGRYVGFLQKWLWALSLIILCSPFEVYQPSFWLSFSAVMIIVHVAHTMHDNLVEEDALQKLAYSKNFIGNQVMQNLLANGWRHIQYLWRIQWSLFIGLLPLSLYFFHQVSLWMIPANLMAVPWVAWVIMPLAWMACISWWFSASLSSVLFHLTANLLQPVWYVLCLFSQWDFLVYHHTQSCLLMVVAAMMLGLLLLRDSCRWSIRLLVLLVWGLLCFVL